MRCPAKGLRTQALFSNIRVFGNLAAAAAACPVRPSDFLSSGNTFDSGVNWVAGAPSIRRSRTCFVADCGHSYCFALFLVCVPPSDVSNCGLTDDDIPDLAGCIDHAGGAIKEL